MRPNTKNTTFIMPTHPLVKQAINCFADDSVQCDLVVKTTELPVGRYPFIVYEWQYKGVKPNNELVVITSDNIDSNLMLRLIYGASDHNGEPYSASYDELEQLHFARWKSQKEKYLAEAQQIIRFKLESLVSSQQGQVRAIQNQLSKTTNERIRVMRQGQFERLEQSFKDKQVSLQTEIVDVILFQQNLQPEFYMWRDRIMNAEEKQEFKKLQESSKGLIKSRQVSRAKNFVVTILSR